MSSPCSISGNPEKLSMPVRQKALSTLAHHVLRVQDEIYTRMCYQYSITLAALLPLAYFYLISWRGCTQSRCCRRGPGSKRERVPCPHIGLREIL
jgi:hypothetical protein